jgi:hypothetical protein
MSVASVLGVILLIGLFGVTLVGLLAWRQRMRESLPAAEWRHPADSPASEEPTPVHFSRALDFGSERL